MTLGREDLLQPRQKIRWVKVGYLKKRSGDALAPPRVIIKIRGEPYVVDLRETLKVLTGSQQFTKILGRSMPAQEEAPSQEPLKLEPAICSILRRHLSCACSRPPCKIAAELTDLVLSVCEGEASHE